MITRIRASFKRDVSRNSHKEILEALNAKYTQIEKAKSLDNMTGLKALRGYSTHYRIIVKSGKYSYRRWRQLRGNGLG